MAMKRCNNGHFYDSSKYMQCPYCGISNTETAPIIMDRPQANAAGGAVGKTMPMNSAPNDEGKTIGIFQKEKGIDPVVGWVVCIEGPSKGADYRIKPERNFIGRNSDMDIALTKDQSVSGRNHAIISYNPKNGVFRLVPGDGHGLTYLNNDEIFSATEIKHGDIIELGATKLRFIPFCDGGFTW